jgi:hypothetical protein
MTLKI